MEAIRGVRLRKFKLRKIILGVRMNFRHMFNPLTLFLYTQGSCTSAKPVCNLLIKWLNKELASLQCCKLI